MNSEQNFNGPNTVVVTKNESGAVITLSVVGLVFGSLVMLGPFIPCLGVIAIILSITAHTTRQKTQVIKRSFERFMVDLVREPAKSG